MKGNKTGTLSFVVIILLTDDVSEDIQSKRQEFRNTSFLVRLAHSLQKNRLLATGVSEFQLDLISIVSKAHLQIPGSPNV